MTRPAPALLTRGPIILADLGEEVAAGYLSVLLGFDHIDQRPNRREATACISDGRASAPCDLPHRVTLLALASELSRSLRGKPRTQAERTALLDKLVAAYPDFLASHDGNTLAGRTAREMPFDDGKGEKDFETRLNSPDIEDKFYAPYPVGRAGTPPGVDIDPGRVRYEPFFVKMYGDCKKGEVTGKLVDVVWLPKHGGKKLKITAVNGVAEKLEAVSADLDELPDSFVEISRPLSRHLQLPRHRRHQPAERARLRRRQSTSTSARRTIGVDHQPVGGKYPTRTTSRWRSSRFSRSTASSGAASGITTTPCISNTGRSCCLKA